MRIFLGILGFAIFSSALGLGLWLLGSGKLSGAEFVAFVISSTVIAGIVSFAPEIQEFSVAGNVVKLREVKNDALRAIEILKKTQTETLRLMLRVKPFINGGYYADPGHSAIDKDFWDIVVEAKRIGGINELGPSILERIEVMLPALYETVAAWGEGWRPGFTAHDSFVEVAADLLNPKIISDTAIVNGEDESRYRGFVKARLAEMESLYSLKRELMHQ